MVRFAAAALLGSAVLVGLVQVAGSQGTKIKIGDAAPTFTGLPGVDGKKHALADYKQDVLVVCITCNHCPVAVAYEDRIINFVKKYGSKVGFVAINVNNLEAD